MAVLDEVALGLRLVAADASGPASAARLSESEWDHVQRDERRDIVHVVDALTSESEHYW